MSPRRTKEKFKQLTEFEQGRIIGLREGGFSCHAIGFRVQWNSFTVNASLAAMDRRAPNNSKNWQWTTEDDDPLTGDHQRLRLQWAHEHRAWHADWHQVIFSDESRFNLGDHDGCIRVRRYSGERCFPNCVIERHSSQTPGVIVWNAISYHGRSNLLQFESDLNSNRYVREVLQLEVVTFHQGTRGATFQQDNACPHVSKTVLDFCSAQHMQLLPWPAY
ncbi:transposable element Tc1 transposase [Trichonephila clavipes]|nr:transposable element Tc1 transposase [Trichonephila clavipes]